MQCQYDYDYGYDYEYAPTESCEEVIIEDVLSAADCASLCYDDWDCADWDFIEDQMICALKQFVSNDHILFFFRMLIFLIIYIRKNLIVHFFSFSV